MPKGQTPKQRTIRKVATGLRKQGLLSKKANTGKLMKMMNKIKKGEGMSPGAMGGRTKAKVTPRTTKMPGGLRRISENMRRQKLKGMVPMTGATKSTIKGAGASGAAMAGQAMKLAKKLKPTGRLNVDDIKRAKQMMLKRKGK